jgi:hypothetical protein
MEAQPQIEKVRIVKYHEIDRSTVLLQVDHADKLREGQTLIMQDEGMWRIWHICGDWMLVAYEIHNRVISKEALVTQFSY